MEAAKPYVERHLQEPLEVERLSREARLARHHFSRVFKEATGRTPGEYRRERTNLQDGGA